MAIQIDEQAGAGDGRPVVAFDHHDPTFHTARVARWNDLRGTCPVAWNTEHGGFWAVSGYDEVATVSRDGATFSSLYDPEAPDGIAYLGIAGVPRVRSVPQAGIAEVEGPKHQALRRAMNPFMLPKAVTDLEALVRAATTWFLDQRIETGSMDLVDDLTSPVPAIATMRIIGLPLDDWSHYAELFHATVAHGPKDDEYRAAIARVPQMLERLLAEANARRAEPRDDLLTALVQLDVGDGRRLADDEITSVLWNLVGGGLDTTTSLTALSLHHLATHPEQRRRLIDEPELLPLATEEMLRYFSVNESLSRTVAHDTVLGGQRLRAGERVLLSWLAANRDPARFERPDEVVLDRTPNPHIAFGVGAHRCIGMHLARSMFQVLVREVLERIPDYEVDEAAARTYRGNPTLNGMVRLPATFTPGPRTGPATRPF